LITIHHLSTSRSERIVWLAEELGIAYRLAWHQREANGAAPAALRELHSLGKAPVIEDDGLVLAESGAIVEYIVQRHGGGRLAVKAAAAEYPGYLYWMHFAEGSLMTLMLIALVLSRVPEAKDGPVDKRIATRLQDMLHFVDARMAGHPWFAGDAFTAADIMMSFPLTTMKRYLDIDLAGLANIEGWLDRIASRPAYRKAMALAGPDAKRPEAAA
jgi:glutathione S-transferase